MLVYYEGELVMVVGKCVKNVIEEDFFDVIFGYVCVNDVMVRDI